MEDNTNERPKLKPIIEHEDYDLVKRDAFELGNGLKYVKYSQGTNTSANYKILDNGEIAGRVSLSFGLKRKNVSFDILVDETHKGHALAITSLQSLANVLDERHIELKTGGISEGSRPYWEKLAARGQVIAIDEDDPETDYKVLPTRENEGG